MLPLKRSFSTAAPAVRKSVLRQNKGEYGRTRPPRPETLPILQPAFGSSKDGVLIPSSQGLTTMPWLGLGTYALEAQTCVNAVREALKMGYRRIDTCPSFSRRGNESFIAEGIKASEVPRNQLWITSKLQPVDMSDEYTVYDSCLRSLSKLGVEYFDLYTIQWPGLIWNLRNSSHYHFRYRLMAWRALERLYNEGKVRSIGLSNFHVPHLKELLPQSRIRPSVVELECHPFLFKENADVMNFCSKEKMVFASYAPLARAIDSLLNNRILKEVAAAKGKSVPQIALRWMLQHQIPLSVKSGNIDHLKENLVVFDFELTAEEMNKIDQESIHAPIPKPTHPCALSVGFC